MWKVAPAAIAIFLGTVLVASAATQTDSATYTVPASVYYTGFSNIDMAIYAESDLSLPVANLSGGTSPAAAYLHTISWTAGSFPSSTEGGYRLVQASLAGCGALSYSACAAANVGMPGAYEADFVIGAAPEGGGTSTITIADATLLQIYLLLDALTFFAALYLWSAGIRKVFKIA